MLIMKDFEILDNGMIKTLYFVVNIRKDFNSRYFQRQNNALNMLLWEQDCLKSNSPYNVAEI